MILSLGWKNVWRGKTRSLVVIVAVMLGIFSGVMATGIMQGWIEQRIHSSIYNEIAHVQIHNPDYMQNEEIQFTLSDYETVAAILDTIPEVEAWSPRVKLFAMAKTSWAASGFVLQGVDVEKEKQVCDVSENIIEGEFLEGEHGKPSIVLGSKAAENLKLLNYQLTKEKLDSIDMELYPSEVVEKLKEGGTKRFRKEKDFRNKLAEILSKEEIEVYADGLINYFSFYRMRANVEVTIQDKNGVIIHPVFRLRGVYKTSNSTFDAMNAYVDRGILNQFTGLSEFEVHEIGIISSDNKTGAELGDKIAGYLPDHDVMSWRKASPEIAMYTDFSHVMGYIYVVIILFALAFGIINTMMMSVLERVKELGMLMAIGMNKKRVFRMIMLESVFLTLTGAIVGMIFSALMVAILSRTGINFNRFSEGLGALGMDFVIYPFLTWDNYLGITLLVILTGMIASIWPARKALKLNPVEALRTE